MGSKQREYLDMVAAEDADKGGRRSAAWLYNSPIPGVRHPRNRKLCGGRGVKSYAVGGGFHAMGKHGLTHPDGTPCDATKPENCPLFKHAVRESKVDDLKPREKRDVEISKVRKLEPEERDAVAKDVEPLMERYNEMAGRCQKAKTILSKANSMLKRGDGGLADKLERAKGLAMAFLAEHRHETALLKQLVLEAVQRHRCRILTSDLSEFGELSMDSLRVENGKKTVRR